MRLVIKNNSIIYVIDCFPVVIYNYYILSFFIYIFRVNEIRLVSVNYNK